MLIDYLFPSQTEQQEIRAGKRKSPTIDTKISVDIITGKEKLPVSQYHPTEEEALARQMIVRHFTLGDLNMRKPRREFNDLSLITRLQIDRMAFNSYQPNDGDALEGNETTAWKSNAMRPITRNKVISIAAHATARLLFPKVFAQNEESEAQEEAAQVMEDLMEWSGRQSEHSKTSLYATINALVEPASIVYTDYAEVYRQIKTVKVNGKWNIEEVLDEDLSGFQDYLVPCDELYIENFYEHDIQKQGWLIWRKVLNYSLAESKYKHFDNFKYVKPGIQIIYDDANRQFYEVYDSTMRPEMVEEVIYWNRTLDLKLIIVNGVLLTAADNPNPRQDKRYPFVIFGYELIDGGRFFYYKSLAFKMVQDMKVVNTLYQMIIDGTYLRLFSPLVNSGQDTIGSDVLIPGAVTTVSPGAELRPIFQPSDIGGGLEAMNQVEKSVSETSMDQWTMMAGVTRRMPAYTMSIMQQNANMLLGLFIQMISIFVKAFGELRLADIIQYLTIVDVTKIEGGSELVFKTFLIPNKQSGGKQITRKLKFDNTLPNKPITEAKKMDLSLEALLGSGGLKSRTELWRINPSIFRNLKFTSVINPDVQNPMSEELEKQYGLEAYDRLIQNPLADPEQVTKEFLLKNYPQSKRDPEKFIRKQQPQGVPMLPQGQIPQGRPTPQGSGGLPVNPIPTPPQQIGVMGK